MKKRSGAALSKTTVETACGTSALVKLAPVIAALRPHLALVTSVVVNARKVIAVYAPIIVAVLKIIVKM